MWDRHAWAIQRAKPRDFVGVGPPCHPLPPRAMMGCGVRCLRWVVIPRRVLSRVISQPAARNQRRPHVLCPVGRRFEALRAPGSATAPNRAGFRPRDCEYCTPGLQQLEEPQLITGSIPSPDCRSEIILLQNRVGQNARPTNHRTLSPNRPPGIFPTLEVIRFL